MKPDIQISAFVISHLLLNSTSQTSIGYFFCRHDDSESLIARTILGSIARQLMSSLPYERYAKLDEDLQGSKPTIDDVFRILKTTLRRDHEYIIIVDGLTECEEGEVCQTIEILNSLLNLGDLKIRAYYSYRTNSIVWPLTAWRVFRVAIRAADVEDDINQYIQISLENRIKDDVLQVGDPYIASIIQEALMQGAQGMFVSIIILRDGLSLIALGSSGSYCRYTTSANSGLMTPYYWPFKAYRMTYRRHSTGF